MVGYPFHPHFVSNNLFDIIYNHLNCILYFIIYLFDINNLFDIIYNNLNYILYNTLLIICLFENFLVFDQSIICEDDHHDQLNAL